MILASASVKKGHDTVCLFKRRDLPTVSPSLWAQVDHPPLSRVISRILRQVDDQKLGVLGDDVLNALDEPAEKKAAKIASGDITPSTSQIPNVCPRHQLDNEAHPPGVFAIKPF